MASGITGKKVTDILGKHLLGYILVSLAILLVVTYVPAISTFLPEVLAK